MKNLLIIGVAAILLIAPSAFGEVIYENDFATPAEPVVTFLELPFRRTKAVLGGISCISVSGNKAAQSLYDQSLEPMIDNLRVTHTLFGFRIGIR